MSGEVVARYGSDVVVDVLCDLGIRFVACNPGATFRGVHDSLVNHRPDAPVIIECTHEEISVAIAHGYVKAAGEPMVAAVHDVVGLQHAAMAIYNAWCDRAPVLVLGGTGPVDAARRRPWIDWIHTASTQAEQVRDYTRWDDQPASVEALTESLVRAHQMATGAPQGPVYVCLDSDVQEQELPEGFERPEVSVFAAPGPLAPAVDEVRRVVGWLAEAENPVLVVESVDRSQPALEALVGLAELLGVPVLEPSRDYNRPSFAFPWAHPLAVTGVPDVLPEADVVVAVEVRDLASVRGLRVAEDARVALVSTAHLGAKAWAADLQRLQRADVHLSASAAPTVHALLAAARELVAADPAVAERARVRTAAIAQVTTDQRARWQAEARAAADQDGPVHPAYLSVVLEGCAGRTTRSSPTATSTAGCTAPGTCAPSTPRWGRRAAPVSATASAPRSAPPSPTSTTTASWSTSSPTATS